MISIFNYIDTAIEILEKDKDKYTAGAQKINSFLEEKFETFDEVVGVTFRIKSSQSLKEKIIRNNLYKAYKAEELVRNVSDIIGIRMECRFIEDETKLYKMLADIFCETKDGIYFHPKDRQSIFLKLDSVQPEFQKNGLEIFRIDGLVRQEGQEIRFELQIKSLVNSFWSEIEHKVIYKNKRFMMIDNFVSELMSSIHQNLVNIDGELHMLFKRCMDNSSIERRDQLSNLLVVLVNDIYSKLVEHKTGFPVSIKPYSESLVKYIFSFSSFSNLEDSRYGETVINVMNWLKYVEFEKIAIGEEIIFDKPFNYENELQKVIGERLLAAINNDFYTNIYFHILFSLEVGNDAQDFISFVKYIEMRLKVGRGKEQIPDIIKALISFDGSELLLESGLEKLYKEI